MTFDEYWQTYGDELHDIIDERERAELIWEDSRRVMLDLQIQAEGRWPKDLEPL